MATIAELANAVVVQKNTLAANLNTMGVEASESEKLNTLVPKVLDILTGIALEEIDVPAVSGSTTYTYNGNTKTLSFTNYNSTKMTRSGTYSAKNAGNYSVAFVPKFGYEWTDGTISAVSSNTNVVTAAVSGNSVIITAVKNGSATVTVNCTQTDNYSSASKTVSVTTVLPYIYGAEWNGSAATQWTRTDDAASFGACNPYVAGKSSYNSPFDNRMPWAGMIIEERTGGTMVKIPKFWYKLEQTENNGMKIQIADKEVDGFHVSPAHTDRGDGKCERDYVYVGRYHCALNTYKSTSGVKPHAHISRENFRTNIHNLGTNIWQADFAIRFTIWLLYLVEFADWNSDTR